MPAFSHVHAPVSLTAYLHRSTHRSPTNPFGFRSFGVMLSPLHFRRKDARPVSYYALFKGWLLLSQPPGCLRTPTSFLHT
jgi:hypothetical protein